MLLSLDHLSERYGVLPSEALSRCSTLDFMVMDLATKWSVERTKPKDEAPKLTSEQMQAMILRAREKQNEINKEHNK